MNKVVENALRNVLNFIVIIFVLVVALELNAKESKNEILGIADGKKGNDDSNGY